MTHSDAIESAALELMHSLPSQGFYELLHSFDCYAVAERMIAAYQNTLNPKGTNP